MTKEKLQAEIKEKVKPGIKPSQLKRSRSLGDIPKAPPSKSTLTKSKSAEELDNTPLTQLEKLETKISVLELKLETSKRELTEKEVEYQAHAQILSDQLNLKQKELENLREK